MKTFIRTIIILALLVFPIRAQQPLKLMVTLSKNNYFIGEPVQVAISIVNISTQTVNVKLWGTIRLELLDEKGKELVMVGSPIVGQLPNASSLQPDQEDYRVILLNDHFGKIFSKTEIQKYFDVGKYTLKIIFSPIYFQADSSEVSFQVINPLNEELYIYIIALLILQKVKQMGNILKPK